MDMEKVWWSELGFGVGQYVRPAGAATVSGLQGCRDQGETMDAH